MSKMYKILLVLLCVQESWSVSNQCANREEWSPVCKWWPTNTGRYIEVNECSTKDGIGVNIHRIINIVKRAVKFNMEPVFNGPFVVGHDVGDVGKWIGLTDNPSTSVQDEESLMLANKESLPVPYGYGDKWLSEQANRTSIVYSTEMKYINNEEWRVTLKTKSPDNLCRNMRHIFRSIFWSVPDKRDMCKSLYPRFDGEDVKLSNLGMGRPWTVSIHVRRGDLLTLKVDKTKPSPHEFFVAASRAAVSSIVSVDPNASIDFFVFSEGPSDMEENTLFDQHGDVVRMNIPEDICSGFGINCRQRIFLDSSMFDTLDCMATTDILIGSRSSFSETGSALSTNIKLMPYWGNVQDRVYLDDQEMLDGDFTEEEKRSIDTAVNDWWTCKREMPSFYNTV